MCHPLFIVDGVTLSAGTGDLVNGDLNRFALALVMQRGNTRKFYGDDHVENPGTDNRLESDEPGPV